jgi:hypothetical protein
MRDPARTVSSASLFGGSPRGRSGRSELASDRCDGRAARFACGSRGPTDLGSPIVGSPLWKRYCARARSAIINCGSTGMPSGRCCVRRPGAKRTGTRRHWKAIRGRFLDCLGAALATQVRDPASGAAEKVKRELEEALRIGMYPAMLTLQCRHVPPEARAIEFQSHRSLHQLARLSLMDVSSWHQA